MFQIFCPQAHNHRVTSHFAQPMSSVCFFCKEPTNLIFVEVKLPTSCWVKAKQNKNQIFSPSCIQKKKKQNTPKTPNFDAEEIKSQHDYSPAVPPFHLHQHHALDLFSSPVSSWQNTFSWDCLWSGLSMSQEKCSSWHLDHTLFRSCLTMKYRHTRKL